MSDDKLVMKVENILKRKLTPDEGKFLSIATQLLIGPKPPRKSSPEKGNVKVA